MQIEEGADPLLGTYVELVTALKLLKKGLNSC